MVSGAWRITRACALLIVRIIGLASCHLAGRAGGSTDAAPPSWPAIRRPHDVAYVWQVEGLQWCLRGVPAALLRIVVQRAPERGHLGQNLSCHGLCQKIPPYAFEYPGYLRVPSLTQTGTQSSIPQPPPKIGYLLTEVMVCMLLSRITARGGFKHKHGLTIRMRRERFRATYLVGAAPGVCPE